MPLVIAVEHAQRALVVALPQRRVAAQGLTEGELAEASPVRLDLGRAPRVSGVRIRGDVAAVRVRHRRMSLPAGSTMRDR